MSFFNVAPIINAYDCITITEVLLAKQCLSRVGYEQNYEHYCDLYHSVGRMEPLLRLSGKNEQISSLINSGPTGVSFATRSTVV